jgi:hypothetical protein
LLFWDFALQYSKEIIQEELAIMTEALAALFTGLPSEKGVNNV